MKIGKSTDTILIVDDTPENLSILSEVLQPHYLVRAANSGARALEAAVTEPRPDLILLDVMMPEMDGYECLAQLRHNPATQDIPVIFVTALTSVEDEQRGLELGAVDYITKPIRPAIVRARVRNHLEMKHVHDWLTSQNNLMEEELARFLEILTHHFQEPVRLQVVFAQMLSRSLPKPISGPTETSMGQILKGAIKLRAMLRDVLLYLEAHHSLPPTKPCSSDEAFDTACRQVNDRISETGAEVDHGFLPPVWVNKHPLIDVFRALLENALSFRDPDRTLHVMVDAEPVNGDICFSVTDNGIGIPVEFRDQVFRIFERLTNDPALMGTGIGLALVRKIVETAKGRVWIEDGVDGGVKVCFTLPSGSESPKA